MHQSLTKFQSLAYYIIYLIVGIKVIFTGAIYYPDSYAFLDMAYNRSPVYASFLKIVTSIFGENFEIPVIIVQYALIAFAIHFFVSKFRSYFNITFLGTTLLQLILLAPCVYWHLVANKLLSESISYALILVVIMMLFKALEQLSIKELLKSLIPVFLLIFPRGQFIVLVPIAFLVLCYIQFFKREWLRGLAVAVAIVILPFVVKLSERGYHLLTHGQYEGNTMTYVHAISSPFYIANAKDVAIFNTEEQRAFFNRTYSSLEKANLTRSQVVKDTVDDYEFFQKNFSKICNARIHESNMSFYEQEGLNYYQQQQKVGELASSMFIPLLKQNASAWFKLFLKNFKHSFGGTKMILLYLVILMYAGIMCVRTEEIRWSFILICVLCLAANNAIIAFAVHSINRYTFYFDWVLFAILIMLLDPIYKSLRYAD